MSTRVSTAGTNAQTMRSIVQETYGTEPGGVLRLAVIARPRIRDDEVLVRVAAASVDMGTWHCLTGLPLAMRLAGFGVRSPKASNPGRAFAGSVESVGRNVTEFKPGDDVYGSCDGSFAEYVCVATKRLAPKPAALSFAQAATVPVSSADDSGVPLPRRVVLIDPREERRAITNLIIKNCRPITVVGLAGSLGEAETQIRAEHAHAALVEIQMPVTQGLVTITALRNQFPDLRIVVCSFHSDPATREAARTHGADGYLNKPLEVDDLVEAIVGL